MYKESHNRNITTVCKYMLSLRGDTNLENGQNHEQTFDFLK